MATHLFGQRIKRREDALAPFGVRIREFPLNPARIRRLVAETTASPRAERQVNLRSSRS